MRGAQRTQKQDLVYALRELVASFHGVFENDWEFTRSRLEDGGEGYIGEGATFLTPMVDDESDNWGNRGTLLDSYRRAVDLLRDLGEDPTDLTVPSATAKAEGPRRGLPHFSAIELSEIIGEALTVSSGVRIEADIRSISFEEEGISGGRAALHLDVRYPSEFEFSDAGSQ